MEHTAFFTNDKGNISFDTYGQDAVKPIFTRSFQVKSNSVQDRICKLMSICILSPTQKQIIIQCDVHRVGVTIQTRVTQILSNLSLNKLNSYLCKNI